MKTMIKGQLDIQIRRVDSPVLPDKIWEIESFCTKILEYGDYSFRKALAGMLSNRLQCTFYIAKHKGNILSVAGCLFSKDEPSIAVLGPVCTDSAYRRKGLAKQLCTLLLMYLQNENIKVVYLGVKDNVPAVHLYKKLGFEYFSGIVMRKLFVSAEIVNSKYSSGQQVVIRRIDWQDVAEVSALFCESASIISFDLNEQIFSTRYVSVQKFLPVFPGLMKKIENKLCFCNVLQTTQKKSIVGIAFIRNKISQIQKHIAVLDFFVLDNFLYKTRDLVAETIRQFNSDNNRLIICYCPDCDIAKKEVLISLGAVPYTVLPGYVIINDTRQDTIIYQFLRK